MELSVSRVAKIKKGREERHFTKKKNIPVRLLKLRPARSRRRDISEDRRKDENARDPAGGIVLILMVPNGTILPEDIDSGNYRLFLNLISEKSLENKKEIKLKQGFTLKA